MLYLYEPSHNGLYMHWGVFGCTIDFLIFLSSNTLIGLNSYRSVLYFNKLWFSISKFIILIHLWVGQVTSELPMGYSFSEEAYINKLCFMIYKLLEMGKKTWRRIKYMVKVNNRKLFVGETSTIFYFLHLAFCEFFIFIYF